MQRLLRRRKPIVLAAALAFAGSIGCLERPRTGQSPPANERLSAGGPASSPTSAPSSLIGPELSVSDLQHVHALTPRLFCGSVPTTDEEFAALARLGIKTVLSVDGVKPSVDVAARHGLRYVHLPFGYDGVPHERELEIGRAVRDLPGPIYIHCHHGLHRGPAGAVVAAIATEGWTNDQAVAALHAIGTSPNYQGLYDSARDFKKPEKEELDRADASFPQVAKLDDLTDMMVQIDNRWDELKAAQKVNWNSPADHPDIDPPRDSLLLRELFREAHREGGPAAGRPADVFSRLAAAEQQAGALESALRTKELVAAAVAAKSITESCAACHARYRDPPLAARASRPPSK